MGATDTLSWCSLLTPMPRLWRGMPPCNQRSRRLRQSFTSRGATTAARDTHKTHAPTHPLTHMHSTHTHTQHTPTHAPTHPHTHTCTRVHTVTQATFQRAAAHEKSPKAHTKTQRTSHVHDPHGINKSVLLLLLMMVMLCPCRVALTRHRPGARPTRQTPLSAGPNYIFTEQHSCTRLCCITVLTPAVCTPAPAPRQHRPGWQQQARSPPPPPLPLLQQSQPALPRPALPPASSCTRRDCSSRLTCRRRICTRHCGSHSHTGPASPGQPLYW